MNKASLGTDSQFRNKTGSKIRNKTGDKTGDPSPDPIDDLPIAYVEVNAEGVITRANRAARTLHSADAFEILGMRAWEFSPEGQAEQDRQNFLATIQSGIEPPVVRRSLYSNGEFRTYELHRTLMRDGEGRVSGVRAATVDVTEAELAHEEAHQARMWLESVLDSMSEAVVITDALGFIRSANPATEALFGWKAAELKGKVIEKAFPLLAYVAEGNAKLSFNMALQSRSRGVATLIDRQRNPVMVELSTSPVLDKSTGYTLGVVSVMQRVQDVCEFVPIPSPDQM
jgi:PAS domain S-box-containing protein